MTLMAIIVAMVAVYVRRPGTEGWCDRALQLGRPMDRDTSSSCWASSSVHVRPDRRRQR